MVLTSRRLRKGAAGLGASSGVRRRYLLACVMVLVMCGMAEAADVAPASNGAPGVEVDLGALKGFMVKEWGDRRPREWGLNIEGFATKLNSTGYAIALMLHACGGAYDSAIIDLLEREGVPATIFVAGPWLKAHEDVVARLGSNPLFEIANHGSRHRPLSVSGRSAYGIAGTRSVEEVVDEVEGNARALEAVVGRKPKLFCPGTAYSDDVAVEIVKALGYIPVGFSVNGDAGATASKAQIVASLVNAPRGSLVMLHMNRPQGFTAEALAEALPAMKAKGVQFVKLSFFLFAGKERSKEKR